MARAGSTNDGGRGPWMAGMAACSWGVGLLILLSALGDGRQSTWITALPLALLFLVAGLFPVFVTRRTIVAKVAVGVMISLLLVGVAIAALDLLMAVGFSSVQ